MVMRYGIASLLCSLVALVAVATSACGFNYKVMKQEPVDAPALAAATTFKWRPISFAEIERLEGYENDQDWKTDILDVQKEYLEIVTERVTEAGLAGKVATVSLEAAVTDGVIIEPVVKRIRQEYNGFSGGYDFLYVDLLFKDATSQKVLFKGHVECTSNVAFGPIGWRARTVNGRMALASWNTIAPIISIIKNQKVDPLED
jgi:hypothetical protein